MAAALASQVRSGWDGRTCLVGGGCAWVFSGAVAFLMRLDFGRQVLLGTMEAFGLFFAALACIAWLKRDCLEGPLATPWVSLVVVLPAGLIWIGLHLPSITTAMRDAGGSRRTRG
jgi:hypothetical protein